MVLLSWGLPPPRQKVSITDIRGSVARVGAGDRSVDEEVRDAPDVERDGLDRGWVVPELVVDDGTGVEPVVGFDALCTGSLLQVGLPLSGQVGGHGGHLGLLVWGPRMLGRTMGEPGSGVLGNWTLVPLGSVTVLGWWSFSSLPASMARMRL